MQVKSVVLDFRGKNHQFKKFIDENKKQIADQDFKNILANAMSAK